MNTAALLKLTRTLLGDPSGDRWSRDELLELINTAQETAQVEIVEADESFFDTFTELTVTAAPNDSLEFDLPSDCGKVKTVERVVSNGPPVPGDPVTFQERNTLPGGAGQAYSYYGYTAGPRYYLRGQKIGIVDPRTGYTARLHYQKVLPALDDDSDTSEIPVEHHRVLALHAAKLAYGITETPFPQDLDREYERKWNLMVHSVEGRRRQKPRYVRYFPG